ncbi:MAG: hypothetical protein ACJ71W_21725 [Terriglobales bacterium]
MKLVKWEDDHGTLRFTIMAESESEERLLRDRRWLMELDVVESEFPYTPSPRDERPALSFDEILKLQAQYDTEWAAMARTHFSVLQPSRTRLNMHPVFEQLETQTAINNQQVSRLLEAIEQIKKLQADRKAKQR